jgi:hypothetical protein
LIRPITSPLIGHIGKGRKSTPISSGQGVNSQATAYVFAIPFDDKPYLAVWLRQKSIGLSIFCPPSTSQTNQAVSVRKHTRSCNENHILLFGISSQRRGAASVDG